LGGADDVDFHFIGCTLEKVMLSMDTDVRWSELFRLVFLSKMPRNFLNFFNYFPRSSVYIMGSLWVFTYVMAVQAERTAKEASEALQRSKDHNLELESKLSQVREVCCPL